MPALHFVVVREIELLFPTSHSCRLPETCGDCVHSPSLSTKTSCSRFRCILGEVFVDLVLDRLLTNRLVFLLPVVGDALLSPAVGYALVLPAVGCVLVLPASGCAPFASFSSFLLYSLGFGPLSIVTHRPSSFFDFALSSAI